MIPYIGTKIMGEEYFLLFNIQAFFRLQNDFPEDVLERMLDNTPEGTEQTFDVFQMLCEEGTAARVRYGYAPPPALDREDFFAMCTPKDLITMRDAVNATIALGCEGEVETGEDTDLILLELKKNNISEQENVTTSIRG